MPSEQELLSAITTRHEAVRIIFDAADARKAEGGDDALSTTEYQTVVDHNKEIEKLEGQVKTMRDERDQQRQARESFRQRDADQRKVVNGLGAGNPRGGDDRDERRGAKSAGQRVVEDPEFKTWLERNTNGGGFTSAKFGSSPRVTFAGGLKALVATTDVGGSEFYGLPATGYAGRPLTIRDLVTTGTTTNNAIDYVVEGTQVNNAAPVADATASSGSTGSKPESSLDFDPASTTVKTIAHWVAVPRSVLADAGQLRMYADSFLRYGVEEELEDQMMTGSGAGNNFTGIRNTPGIQSQAWDTDLLTTLRRARTKVRTVGRSTPTGYVLHPNDWEDIDLLQDNEGRYFFGGPSVLGQPRLWGLPVVESEGETEGYAHVADWRRAVLLDRELIQILMSDSHSDFFTRNLIAMLAELRAAFFVIRPSAFVEADLTA
jgi:hypothetical protein